MAMLVHFQMSVVCYLPSTSGQTLSETLVITESGDVYSLTVAAGKCNQALHVWNAFDLRHPGLTQS